MLFAILLQSLSSGSSKSSLHKIGVASSRQSDTNREDSPPVTAVSAPVSRASSVQPVAKRSGLQIPTNYRRSGLPRPMSMAAPRWVCPDAVNGVLFIIILLEKLLVCGRNPIRDHSLFTTFVIVIVVFAILFQENRHTYCLIINDYFCLIFIKFLSL